MTVIVTRPSPQGQALCKELGLLGISARHQALINIERGSELSELPVRFRSTDIVIAVSQHAVDFAHQHLSKHQIPWPKATYLAIGQKTAHSLSKAAQQNVNYPVVSDSEHFIQLAELKNIHNKKVVILRGNGGRELIKQALEEKGAIVQYCEAYQRVPLSVDFSTQIRAWQQNCAQVLIITSSEQLQLLIESTPNDKKGWLTQRHLVVPSKRISADGQRLGFSHITVANSASNNDLIIALQSIQDLTYER